MDAVETPRTMSDRARHPVLGVLASLALTALVAPAAAAFVVFEPTRQPAPERWPVEVAVAVEWADVTMRIPQDWKARVKREPPEGVEGASLMVVFGPDETICLLDQYGSRTVETWQDVGLSPAAELTIDGHRAERFDDMLGSVAATSAYSIHAGEQVYALQCIAEQAPGDRWLSLAETITVP